MSNFHTLNVTKTILHPEINAKTICFSIVRNQSIQYIWQDYNGVKVYTDFPDDLHWKAGQYLPVHIEIGDEIFSGKYPITVAPESALPLQITVVKDMEDPVSDFLTGYIHLGDELKISAPTNRYYIEPNPNQIRHYYFFASHTGIFSVYAMIQSIITTESKAYINLLYINDHQHDILLKDKIEPLENHNQINIQHFLTNADDFPCWQSGVLDKPVIQQFLNENPAKYDNVGYYISANPLISEQINEALIEHGCDSQNIYKNDLTTCL